jgi:hypothetical protein
MKCNIQFFSNFPLSKWIFSQLLLGAMLIRAILFYLEISQKPILKNVTSTCAMCRSFEAWVWGGTCSLFEPYVWA